MRKLVYIDSLRGLAILSVLLVHCGQHGSQLSPSVLQLIVNNGLHGVQLFFVASAFTLFLSMSKRSKEESNAKSNFFIRRFFRIAPLYYLGIIYYLIQNGRGPRPELGDVLYVSNWNIISNFFFVHGFNPYWINAVVPGGWSITVEVLFYCFVPFIFKKVRNLNQALNLFIISIILNFVLSMVLRSAGLIPDHELMDKYLYYYLPNQLPVFACGIILFFLITCPKETWYIKPETLLLLACLFLCFLSTFYLSIERAIFFPGHVLYAIGFVALGFALSKKKFFLLSNPITSYIGKISYSMYLVHFSILHLMESFNLFDLMNFKNKYFNVFNFGLRYAILLCLTVIVSTAVYHLIELPFQRIGKKIIDRNIKPAIPDLNLFTQQQKAM